MWSVALRPPGRPDEFSRWAKPAIIVAFAATNGYVALAIGSLALSPWADGNGAAEVLFFLVCGVYATGALALYPYVCGGRAATAHMPRRQSCRWPSEFWHPPWSRPWHDHPGLAS